MNEIEMLRARIKSLESELEYLRTRCFMGAEKYFDNKQYGLLKIVTVRDQANYVPEDPLKCFTCYWNDYDRADAVWCNCKGCPKNPKT